MTIQGTAGQGLGALALANTMVQQQQAQAQYQGLGQAGWTGGALGGATTTSTQFYITTSSSTTSTNVVGGSSLGISNPYYESDLVVHAPRLKVRPGMTLLLPDGAEIDVDGNGNYVIKDEDAKVTYKANRVLEFNRYLNASDLLEDFFTYLASMGVRRRELKDINVNMFVAWLIIQAAEKDGAEEPRGEIKLLESHVKPLALPSRCKCCGRFLPRAHHAAGVQFCNGLHMDSYMTKRKAIAA